MILRVPKGSPGCSAGGVFYSAKKGIIKVPDEVGPELFAHGCKEIIPGEPTAEEIAAVEKQLIEENELAEKEALEEAARQAALEAIEKKAAEAKEAPKSEG